MKRSLILITCLFILISLTFSCSKKENKDTITLSGAFAIYPTAVEWGKAYEKINPNIKIEISAGGAGKGVSDCIGGLVDIGMVSRDPDPQELAKGIDAIPICHDGVFVLVNAKNTFVNDILSKGIKREIVKELYIDGKKLTFEEVLGKNDGGKTSMNVYTRSDSCGAAATFAKFLGNYKQENLNGVGINTDPQMINAVLNDINGISYANFSYVFTRDGKIVDGVKIVPIDLNEDGTISSDEKIDNLEDAKTLINKGVYPISRTNYFFVKKDARENVKKFIRFCLSDDGTKILDEVGTSLPLEKGKREEIKNSVK